MFIYGGMASLLGRASLLCQDPASQFNYMSKSFFVKLYVKIFFRLYKRRASHPWRDLAIDCTISRPRGLQSFHLNVHKRAGLLGGLASQSSLQTTKFVLASICLDNFHFTNSVFLCVGYEMKTCTQISGSGCRVKINVVIPVDSAKWPGRVGWLAFQI